jgi:hypothetical protein
MLWSAMVRSILVVDKDRFRNHAMHAFADVYDLTHPTVADD